MEAIVSALFSLWPVRFSIQAISRGSCLVMLHVVALRVASIRTTESHDTIVALNNVACHVESNTFACAMPCAKEVNARLPVRARMARRMCRRRVHKGL